MGGTGEPAIHGEGGDAGGARIPAIYGGSGDVGGTWALKGALDEAVLAGLLLTVTLEPVFEVGAFVLAGLWSHDDECLFGAGEGDVGSVEIVDDDTFAFLDIIIVEDGKFQIASQGDGEEDVLIWGMHTWLLRRTIGGWLIGRGWTGEIDLEGVFAGFAPEDVAAS